MGEGTADDAFLDRLIVQHGLASQACVYQRSDKFYSRDMFGKKLGLLDDALKGGLVAEDMFRGVIIVADTAEQGAATRDHIRRQIADPFVAPTACDVLPAAPAGKWPVAIMLVPGETRPGGLETLCFDAMAGNRPDVASCVDAFFACVRHAVPASRTAEKLDKARLACFFAAVLDDPTKAVRYAFETAAPIFELREPAFADIATRLRALLAA